MNYSKILLNIVCIIIFNTHGIKASFESYSGFEKDNKKIIVLGDIHASCATPESSLAKLDQLDTDIINFFIKTISVSSNRTNFILESSESYLSRREKLFQLCKHKDLYHSLPFQARENKYFIGSISFTLGDNRPLLIRNMIEMFTVLDNPFFRNANNFFIAKENIKDLLGEVGTIDDFFKETKKIIKQLKIFIKDESLSIIAPFLQKILTTIKRYKTIGKNSFTAEELETSYVNVFASLFQKTQDINSLTEPLYSWILPLSDNLLDCNFFIETAKALENYDQIVLFVGNNHAVSLHKFLKYLDFKPIIIDGLTKKSKGPALFVGPRFDRDRLSTFLSNVFNRSSTDKSDKPITNCAFCDKPNCSKKCSLCKLSYYCSRKCQKNHWALHKLECKNK